MSYDPDERRDTPLALNIRALIAERGPIPVKRFMQLCLTHPEHGYYRHRLAIGRDGDFITAPEISQVFGELIGLWAAVVWQQMGAPKRFNLIELGPGRGTMLADALRASRLVPGFLDAAEILLVEPNARLREAQAKALQAHLASLRYIGAVDDLPAQPSIIVANEVLDCIPIDQFTCSTDTAGKASWRQRVVVLDDAGRLQYGDGEAMRKAPQEQRHMLDEAPDGAILEQRDLVGFMDGVIRAAARAPLCALFIDYGHTSTSRGDTLQAVRDHQPEHPLTSPGEADLTSHVDFQALAMVVQQRAKEMQASIAIDGPVSQAEFLGRLGIVERASRLMSANPDKAGEIEAGVARLLSPAGMGTRFKAIGIRSSGLPPLPGLQP